MQSNYQCPKCSCEHSVRLNKSLIAKTVPLMWCLFCLGAFIQPILMIASLSLIAFSWLVSIHRLIFRSNQWLMSCCRCGNCFYTTNPDKVKAINAKSLKNLDKQKQVNEALTENGAIQVGEKLKAEISDIGFHSNAFVTIPYKAKVTDKNLYFFNDKHRFVISKANVQSINKKNYFLVIPTGVTIKVSDKIGNYNFVLLPKDRSEVIEKLNGVVVQGV